MFKVNNRTGWVICTKIWCLYCQLGTYFTLCSTVSVANLKQVNGDWEDAEMVPSKILPKCCSDSGAYQNPAKQLRWSFCHLCLKLHLRCLTGFWICLCKNSQQRWSIRKGILKPATLLKKKLWYRFFPVNVAKFLRTPSLQNTPEWLPL